jgi:hypothetical protein
VNPGHGTGDQTARDDGTRLTGNVGFGGATPQKT